ncbi:hypothetical protein M422DRAFT_52535 [Sphaerobolus stellatus SS14]|uniref:Glycolipid transfer protein domain-containing protein n=1 Tax=Sphaerobolus stellatus (strain SS14) TaxID=990650 RepID=A0A0C9V771_SPHS4|nr:hypothetical protein M422DRAFT_52535 [Sphaerobolus stellatus SS14]
MTTYFDSVKKSFADVPVTDAGVDTVAFLEACEGLVGLFDLLGSTAFAAVTSDMNGNIKKVRTRYEANKATSDTLEHLVAAEKAEKKNTATEGLMWLLRGLNFTAIALQRSQADAAEELNVSFNKSYDGTLKKYHNFVVKGVFSVRIILYSSNHLAMKACPYRKDFYAKLGSPPERVQEEFEKWLTALDKILKRLNAFYEKGAYGTSI